MYNDVDMTRYSLETVLELTGCVTLKNAFLHRRNQLCSFSDGFI